MGNRQASSKEKNSMAAKIYINEGDCIGCEGCVDICPQVFELDEETETARVIRNDGAPVDLIEEAIETCPGQCIRWTS
jgi:ferredoxin